MGGERPQKEILPRAPKKVRAALSTVYNSMSGRDISNIQTSVEGRVRISTVVFQEIIPKEWC